MESKPESRSVTIFLTSYRNIPENRSIHCLPFTQRGEAWGLITVSSLRTGHGLGTEYSIADFDQMLATTSRTLVARGPVCLIQQRPL